MCRCVSCDAPLQGAELVKLKPDGSFEDMCQSCLKAAFDTTVEKTYVLNDAKQGLTRPKRLDNY